MVLLTALTPCSHAQAASVRVAAFEDSMHALPPRKRQYILCRLSVIRSAGSARDQRALRKLLPKRVLLPQMSAKKSGHRNALCLLGCWIRPFKRYDHLDSGQEPARRKCLRRHVPLYSAREVVSEHVVQHWKRSCPIW